MGSQVLILPGYGNSDENHWQSLWESEYQSFHRVNQQSWDNPICDDWVNTLEKAVGFTKGDVKKGDVKIVAHSLGCLLLAKWAEQTKHKISGALLIAVPDPKGDNFPKDALGFYPVAKSKLNFPSTVIASNNDPYSHISFAKKCADHWGSTLIELGDYGHINSESRVRDWPFGLEQLNKL